MASDAGNFTQVMKRAWERQSGELNAVTRALNLDAVRVRAYPEANERHWINKPGDIPCSLYRFKDGTFYVIADDGHSIFSPNRPGKNLLAA